MKQPDFAKRLGLVHRKYQNYEINGVPVAKRPTIQGSIVKYAKALNIDLPISLKDKEAFSLDSFSDDVIVTHIYDNRERFQTLPSFKMLICKFN